MSMKHHNVISDSLIASQSVLNRIIAVDVDGTIVSKNSLNFPEIGLILSGAKKALQLLQKHGYIILIYTLRISTFIKSPSECGFHLEDLINFLDSNEIPYDFIWNGKGKPPASIFIDDRAIEYKDKIGWSKIVGRILKERK